MKNLKDFKTKKELEKLANKIIGDGNDCEKNLFMSASLFLQNYTAETENDWEHMLELVLANKSNFGQESDFDRIMSQISTIDPASSCLVYHRVYQLYPNNIRNIAAGNLSYAICRILDKWPRGGAKANSGNPDIVRSTLQANNEQNVEKAALSRLRSTCNQIQPVDSWMSRGDNKTAHENKDDFFF